MPNNHKDFSLRNETNNSEPCDIFPTTDNLEEINEDKIKLKNNNIIQPIELAEENNINSCNFITNNKLNKNADKDEEILNQQILNCLKYFFMKNEFKSNNRWIKLENKVNFNKKNLNLKFLFKFFK